MQNSKDKKTKDKKKIKLKDVIANDNKQITLGFTIVSAILILSFTLLFVFLGNPTLVTISNMGNRSFEGRIAFIVWGCVSAVLFGLIMIRMFNTYKYTSKKARNLVRLSYIFLIGCVLLPCMYEFPFLSKVHVVFGVSFAFCACLSIFFFLRYLKSVNKKIGNVSLILYFSALFFPALTFFIFGHCGVYEIAFFVVISIFLVVFEIYLRKHKNSLFPLENEEKVISEIVNKEMQEIMEKYNDKIAESNEKEDNQISMFKNNNDNTLNPDIVKNENKSGENE